MWSPRQKAPRTGLNTSLLLQKRHLGLLPENSYCRYCIILDVCTCIHGRVCGAVLIHFTTPTAAVHYRGKKGNPSLTLMIISSVCSEQVFFGAFPTTNNDANRFRRELRNSILKKSEKGNKNMLICAALQFELWEFNSVQLQKWPKYSSYWQTFL